MKKGFEGDFGIYISTFSLIESFIHFMDWFLLQKAIRDGFSYREFKKERSKYVLSPEETEQIDVMLKELKEDENINFIEIASMHEEFFGCIIEYVENYVDFLDAIHIRIALDVKCDYFITKDGELRRRLQNLISQRKIDDSIKIASVSGFLKRLKA